MQRATWAMRRWSVQAEGFSVIPLQLSLAADRLDSAHAEYAVTAIALHEIRGDEQGAKALRERLDLSLAPYVALLDASGSAAGKRRRIGSLAVLACRPGPVAPGHRVNCTTARWRARARPAAVERDRPPGGSRKTLANTGIAGAPWRMRQSWSPGRDARPDHRAHDPGQQPGSWGGASVPS
ncbi:MAG: hypothetical protein IPH86_19610 [bacterium]|nr:hypothetical protein [bacterium]